MLEDIRSIWRSFVEMVLRFLNGRFIPNEEISYLRMELDKSRIEKDKLIGYILELTNPASPTEPEIDLDKYKPIENFKKPWHIRKQELEQKSRERAAELAKEANLNTERSKSTEQLEREILGDVV